ncbi:MAG: sulfite exporter TauE/SafE family protein [Deltaproteobacteria bacterium]|nr:sulfite exporter TauE/SafE family protein [Deltaproteobacteria bacterium]
MVILPSTYAVILPAVFLAGVVDAIAGGGGLLSVPAYLAAGVPPHLALGTNKFSACFGTALATARYLKHGMVDLRVALPSAACAVLGAMIGTRTVLTVDPAFLRYVLLVAIPFVAFITLQKSRIGLEQATQQVTGHVRWFWILCGGLLVGFYDGFFGPGTGSFLILLFAWALKYDFARANGNTKVVNLATNMAALAMFTLHGEVSLALGVPAALCGIAGNWIGSKLVILRGNAIIRPMFLIGLAILLAKIGYDLLACCPA